MGISPIQGIIAHSPSRVPAQLAGTSTLRGGRNAPSTMLTGSPTGADLPSLVQVDVAVSQMLDALGRGAEENATLRAVITLLILLTLLASLQDSGRPSTTGARASGGNPSGEQVVGFYASYTRFSFEQTTTSIAWSSVEPGLRGDFTPTADACGGQINLTG